MTSYLRIAFLGGSALLQVHCFQNGILAILLFESQRDLLNLPLPFQFGLFGFLLRLSCSIVRKEIHLLKGAALSCGSLVNDIVGYQRQSPDQKVLIYDALLLLCHSKHYFLSRSCVSVEIDRSVSVLRDLPSIAIGDDFAVVLSPAPWIR